MTKDASEPGASADEPEDRRRGSALLRNEAFRTRYLSAVRLSLNKEDRAKVAGASSRLIRMWENWAAKSRADGKVDEYTEFMDQIDTASSERVMRNMLKADHLAHTDGNWSALKFLLGRDGYHDPLMLIGDEKRPVILRFDKQDEEA